jgi:hypothetical protein
VLDHPPPGAAATLLDAGVIVLRDLESYLVALATPAELEALKALRVGYQAVDEDPEGKTYYVATLHRGVTIDGSLATVLFHSPVGALIEATPEQAHALSAQGVELAKLIATPMRAPGLHKEPPRVAPPTADAVVQAMVDSVSGDTINAHVQRLEDFVNRYSGGDSVLAARDWIKARFVSYGIDSVAFQQFDSLYGENVIAVKPGVGHPDKHVIIGGHYDSINLDVAIAPGADDNASGTACVLECARVLGRYDFDYTIIFIAFCGEEQGLLGSEAYAARARANGDDIVAMVNADMIGYLWEADPFTDIDIISNVHSQWLRDLLMDVAGLYVPELDAVDGLLPGGATSDHASFWRHGFDAVMFWEDTDHWSPFRHTDGDLVGPSYNSPELARGTTKMAVALVATLAERFRVIIQHEPLSDNEDVESVHRVLANILHVGPLDPDSLFVHYTVSLRGQRIEETLPLRQVEGDEYEAFIPPQVGGSAVDYYIVAQHSDGFRALDPKSAPIERHRFVVGTPVTIVEDDFSTDTGWTAGAPDDDATRGLWIREAPVRSFFQGETIQPGSDHTPGADSVCFVTGNHVAEATHSFRDVDNGKTTLLSPVYDLSRYSNAWVGYHRWYSNDSGGNVDDEWAVDVSSDGGRTWERMETLARSERAWTKVALHVPDFVPLTSSVQFRFVAEDSGDPSVVEGLIDDFEIVTYIDPRRVPSRQPRRVTLAQNEPNPFNPRTVIRLTVEPPGRRATLRVYNVAGRLVATLLEDEFVSGERVVEWNGRNRSGNLIASGVYFYDLRTMDARVTRKMVVIR